MVDKIRKTELQITRLKERISLLSSRREEYVNKYIIPLEIKLHEIDDKIQASSNDKRLKHSYVMISQRREKNVNKYIIPIDDKLIDMQTEIEKLTLTI